MAALVYTFHHSEFGLIEQIVLLQRQGPLGTFVGPQNQPTDVWPIKLLRTENGRLYECSRDTIHREVYPTPDLGQRQVALWIIAFRCAHVGCGGSNTIFAIEYADGEGERSLRNALSKATLEVCNGHKLELDQNSVRMWPLPY